MNDAQTASPHRQFCHSPHRHRITSLVVQNTILIQRVIWNGVDPGFPTLVGHEEESEAVDYAGDVDYFQIERLDSKNWRWNHVPSDWQGVRCGLGDRGSSGIFTGVGVYSEDHPDLPSIHGRMRIWYPASGTIGFYETGSITSAEMYAAVFNRTLYQSIDPALTPNHYIDVESPEVVAEPGEYNLGICCLFFGCAPWEIPLTLPFDAFISFDFP